MPFPYYICVPHQRPAYIDHAPELIESVPESERDPSDRVIVGDHDLSDVHIVESMDDARTLTLFCDETGKQTRHQAIRVATLAEEIIAANE